MPKRTACSPFPPVISLSPTNSTLVPPCCVVSLLEALFVSPRPYPLRRPLGASQASRRPWPPEGVMGYGCRAERGRTTSLSPPRTSWSRPPAVLPVPLGVGCLTLLGLCRPRSRSSTLLRHFARRVRSAWLCIPTRGTRAMLSSGSPPRTAHSPTFARSAERTEQAERPYDKGWILGLCAVRVCAPQPERRPNSLRSRCLFGPFGVFGPVRAVRVFGHFSLLSLSRSPRT